MPSAETIASYEVVLNVYREEIVGSLYYDFSVGRSVYIKRLGISSFCRSRELSRTDRKNVPLNNI